MSGPRIITRQDAAGEPYTIQWRECRHGYTHTVTNIFGTVPDTSEMPAIERLAALDLDEALEARPGMLAAYRGGV